jgi:hypothetical protein
MPQRYRGHRNPSIFSSGWPPARQNAPQSQFATTGTRLGLPVVVTIESRDLLSSISKFSIFAVRPDGAYHQWRKDLIGGEEGD